jgi:hypothetical protein
MGVRSALLAIGSFAIACMSTTPPPARPAASGTPAAGPAAAAQPAAYADDRLTERDPKPGPKPEPKPEAPGFPAGSLRLNNTWADCVKDFVDAQTAGARDLLVDALSVYFTTCDRVERRVVVEAPRPSPSGHDYAFESHISFGGHLTKTQSKVWLSVEYHGDSPIQAERIKVAADEFRWTSPPLRFEHAGSGAIWEHADIPYTKNMQGIVRKMIEAKDVIVRFEGPRSHADLVVTDEMKHDLKLMMDALAAIRIP